MLDIVITETGWSINPVEYGDYVRIISGQWTGHGAELPPQVIDIKGFAGSIPGQRPPERS